MIRTLFLSLLLLPFLLSAQSPKITIKIVNGKGKTIKVVRPTNGIYYLGALADHTLNEAGEWTIPNTEKKPGAWEFYNNRWYRLYVQPNRSYTLTIGEKDSIAVEAPDKEAQLALNKLNFEFYQNVGNQYYKQDSTFAVNKARVEADIARQMAPFQALQQQKAISSPCYQYATMLIQHYYAAVLGATLIRPMMKKQYQKDSTGYNPQAVQEMQQHWAALLAMSPVKDPAAMGVSTYYDHVRFYNQWYLHYLQPLINTGQASKDNFWEIGHYRVIQNNYPEPLKEYLTATWMYELLMQQEFQAFLPGVYDQYNKQYPKSAYVAPLKPEIEKVKQYHAKIKSRFTEQQRFLPQYDTITSVASLAAQFSNKVVYVDLWATWCGPCKAEFAFKDSLQAYCRTKGVEMLYVSIDKPKAENTWHELIRYYNLEGNHLRASEALLKDIYRVFGNKGSLAIPRYVILKNGQIVQAEAKAPGDKSALYEQIGTYL